MKAAARSGKAPVHLLGGDGGLPDGLVAPAPRDRILAGMLATVAEKGYAETSVADVLEAAGTGRATFYEQFTDKEDCFLAMYRELIARMFAHVERAYDAAADWPEAVVTTLAALLRYLADNEAVARVIAVEPLAAGDRARAHYREAVRAFLPLVSAGREAADPQADPPADAEIVVVGGTMHMVFQRVMAGQARNLMKLLPDLTFLVAAPYLGPERALELSETARQRELNATGDPNNGDRDG